MATVGEKAKTYLGFGPAEPDRPARLSRGARIYVVFAVLFLIATFVSLAVDWDWGGVPAALAAVLVIVNVTRGRRL